MRFITWVMGYFAFAQYGVKEESIEKVKRPLRVRRSSFLLLLIILLILNFRLRRLLRFLLRFYNLLKYGSERK